MMTPAARQARAVYMKAWRTKNPERVKANAANYWERQGQKLEEQKK